jgi:hypothetical protein
VPWGDLTAPFTLLPTETSVSLRVVVDRSTVEAFAGEGRAVVSARDFPLEQETAVRLRNCNAPRAAAAAEAAAAAAATSSLLVESVRGWSMGCGWTAA